MSINATIGKTTTSAATDSAVRGAVLGVGTAAGPGAGQRKRRARGSAYIVVQVGACLTYAYDGAAVEAHVLA